MRDLVWMGRSLEDVSDFPRDVKRAFGFALREVQKGATPAGAKPLPQLGSGVYELRDRYSGDAFRAVYAVKLVRAVYVLHAFKKKSKSGIAIPRAGLNMISQRLKRAKEIDQEKDEGRER